MSEKHIEMPVQPDEAAGEAEVQFLVGTMPDGRVVLDFRMRPVDHLKLTQAKALDLAETLVEAVRQARDGVIIRLPQPPGG